MATIKLEAAAHEITQLRKEIKILRETDNKSEIMYLRLRLNALEERAKSHLDRRGQEELLEKIERLNIDSSPKRQIYDGHTFSIKPISNSDDVFVDDSKPTDGFGYRVMRHSSSRASSRKPTSASNGSIYTNGLVTPIPESVDLEEPVDFRELPIQVSIEEDEPLQESTKVDETSKESQEAEPLPEAPKEMETEAEVIDDTKVQEEETTNENAEEEILEDTTVNDENVDDDEKVDNEEKTENEDINTANDAEADEEIDETPTIQLPREMSKTPWQMLWDELADFAGIHDEYVEDENDEHLAY
jgi:hypothetical protein